MTAQKISFFSLYRRNVKGVWNDLSDPSYGMDDYGMPIRFLFLPLTLTIGAGIKSLIDYFTRKPLSPEEYEQTENKLSAMNEDDIEICAATISKNYPAPKSKSSNALIQLLISFVNEKVIRAEVQSQIEDRKLDSAIEHLKTEGISISSRPKCIISLSETDLEELDKRTPENLNAKKQEVAENKRDNLISFFTNPYNAGKKMQRAIMEATFNIKG